jgi:hypothetical protein
MVVYWDIKSKKKPNFMNKLSRFLSLIAFLFICSNVYSIDIRKSPQLLSNGDLENIEDNTPLNWTYLLHTEGISIDTQNAYSGNKCIEIKDYWTGRSAGVNLQSDKISGIQSVSMYDATAMFKIKS